MSQESHKETGGSLPEFYDRDTEGDLQKHAKQLEVPAEQVVEIKKVLYEVRRILSRDDLDEAERNEYEEYEETFEKVLNDWTGTQQRALSTLQDLERLREAKAAVLRVNNPDDPQSIN